MYIQIANSTPCDLYLFLCEFFCFVFVCFLIKDATKPQEIHSDSTVAHSLSAVTSTCSQRVFYWGSGSLSSIMIWETLSLNACRHLLLVCLAGVRLNFNFPEALEKEFTFFFLPPLTPRKLWTDCAGTSIWDWCYWCARWPATAATVRPRRLQMQLQPAETRSRAQGG